MAKLAAGCRLVAALAGLGPLFACSSGTSSLVIGSKNFTEQDLLGELVAQWVESTTEIRVDRRLHLGGTFICHQALVAGDIDMYVEYTGTALSAILERDEPRSPQHVLDAVRREYTRRFGLVWTEPFGFENTFAILVRGATADSLGLTSISSAADHTPGWTPGFGYEFVERADGFAGLADRYDLKFARSPRVMDLGLTYRALASGAVDLIAGNSTDGQIELLDLRMLSDDRAYFPPYYAAPVVREDALERFPGLRETLRSLDARISTTDMRRLNRAVDVDGRDYRVVAREWVAAALDGTSGRNTPPAVRSGHGRIGNSRQSP
ncbi:MAG: glycine betaine ABC transporter substrate-binding protein [Gemmatimonadota bacterium]